MPPPSLLRLYYSVRSLCSLFTFQTQERHRFSNPHSTFTYRVHGAAYSVGPVKAGITASSTKVKSHPALSDTRPPLVSAVALVRDAVARLPRGGEGTRLEIEELTRDSQYLSAEARANPQILSNFVSGALDRLQNEPNPCVRFESGRRLWINLHHGTGEEEFGECLIVFF